MILNGRPDARQPSASAKGARDGGRVPNAWAIIVSPWRVMTGVGRSALGIAIGSWLLGLRLGWAELFLVAACCAVMLVIAVPFVVGRPGLDITIELDPARVPVGSPAVGRLVVAGKRRGRLRSVLVEVRVDTGLVMFQIPSLASASHDELFSVPTDRRAVITIGPVRAVRSDPLGLLRRDAVHPAVAELFVHPRITALATLGAGLRRDIEGQATRDLTSSDLAFHALREYVPGDDWRHVHWRSTAKTGKLVVRQYQDTRRLELTIVVDGATASYRSAEEFELAMSVAGSIATRAARDGQEVCLVAASHAVQTAVPRRLLDTLSRGAPAEDGQDLATLAGRASRAASGTSAAVLLTGSVVQFDALRAASVIFGPDIKTIGIRVEPDTPPRISRSGNLTVLGVRELADVPLLLATAVSE